LDLGVELITQKLKKDFLKKKNEKKKKKKKRHENKDINFLQTGI
jgi:hypothetical protein